MPRAWALMALALAVLAVPPDLEAKGAPRRTRPPAAARDRGAPRDTAPSSKRVYRVAAVGDSLTAVRSHGGKYLDHLRKQCPESRFDNYGRGGQTVWQMRRRFALEVLGQPRDRRHPKPAYSHVIVFGGVNDLINDSAQKRSTNAITADLHAMYTMARRAGVKVVAITVSPWGGLKGHYDARRARSTQDVNRWILGQRRDGKIDFALDSTPLLSCGDPERLCASFEMKWIRDGLHFNASGHEKLGQALHQSVFSDCR